MKQVAILRGINVGGKRKILMTDLKELFKELGFSDIVTYIQSGNVIFNVNRPINNLELATTIESAISDKFGFDVPVIVRTHDEIQEILTSNPFLKDNGVDVNTLYLTFLKEIPEPKYVEAIEAFDPAPDKYIMRGRHVFILYSERYSQSKLTNDFFEKKLKTSATTRNWKTIMKIAELSAVE